VTPRERFRRVRGSKFCAYRSTRAPKPLARAACRDLTIARVRCEHTFVSSRPSHIPYARFIAALHAGDLGFILRHSDGLTFGLPDAVRVCQLISERDPERLDAASLRWIRRYASEAAEQRWDDYRLIVDAFGEIRSEPEPAALRLLSLCTARRLDR